MATFSYAEAGKELAFMIGDNDQVLAVRRVHCTEKACRFTIPHAHRTAACERTAERQAGKAQLDKTASVHQSPSLELKPLIMPSSLAIGPSSKVVRRSMSTNSSCRSR